jgi:hypothetical protein
MALGILQSILESQKSIKEKDPILEKNEFETKLG